MKSAYERALEIADGLKRALSKIKGDCNSVKVVQHVPYFTVEAPIECAPRSRVEWNAVVDETNVPLDKWFVSVDGDVFFTVVEKVELELKFGLVLANNDNEVVGLVFTRDGEYPADLIAKLEKLFNASNSWESLFVVGENL